MLVPGWVIGDGQGQEPNLPRCLQFFLKFAKHGMLHSLRVSATAEFLLFTDSPPDSFTRLTPGHTSFLTDLLLLPSKAFPKRPMPIPNWLRWIALDEEGKPPLHSL